VDVSGARKHSTLRRVLITSLWAFIALVVFAGTFSAGLLAAPYPSDATVQESGTVTLVDASGRKFATLTPPDQRTPITSLDQVSPVFVQAITAAEDKDFFKHSGVDPLAIVRAAYSDATGGNEQGGSTITQQYVKKVYTGGQRTILRKIREAALAVRLEQHKSKQEILRLYLNTIYFGSGLYGIEAASEGYFGVHAKQLDLAQASLLAGVVPAPSAYSPRVDWDKAHERQEYVLNRMVAAHDVSEEQAADAYAQSARSMLVKQRQARSDTQAPEYTDEVVRQLQASGVLGTDIFSHGNITVHTTLDEQLQQAMEQADTAALDQYQGTGVAVPEIANVAIDPRTGGVKALVTKPAGGYKRAGYDIALQAHRTSGSTVKVFTLAAALASGQWSLNNTMYGPAQVSEVVPGCTSAAKPWQPKNDEGQAASLSLKEALAQSVNTIYGPLALDVGLTKVRDLATSMGIPTVQADPKKGINGIGFDGDLPGCPVHPARALGIPVTPIDLATGYATVASGGEYRQQKWVGEIDDADGRTLVGDKTLPSHRALSPAVAAQVQDAMRAVVNHGTGVSANTSGVAHDLFGKTGTVDDHTDAWWVGCDPSLCIVTWVGYDNTTKADNLTPNSVLNPNGANMFGADLPAHTYANIIADYAQLRVASHQTPLPAGADAQPSAVPYVPAKYPSLKYGQYGYYNPTPSTSGGASTKGKKSTAPTKKRSTTPAKQEPTAPAPPQTQPVVPVTQAPPPSTEVPTAAPTS
jgi:penicillin-binding protein 1A